MNLISKLENLRKREHEATVEIVRMLVECDRTGAHLELGYGSIWDFLTRHLNYSNAAASRRYRAMRAAKRDPRALDMLAKHQTNLSALAMVESSLEEAPSLLTEITGKSQRQVEQIVARRNPQKKRKERVRPIAVKQDDGLFATATSAAEVEDRVALAFDVSTVTHEDIQRAKAILSRKHPKGVTLDLLMQELLAHFLQSHAPRPRERRKAAEGSRHVPVATRDAVFERDGHRCTFEGPDGTRCNSQHDLELDHIEPWALGGTHDPANLRVLCAKHNQYRARQTFGEPLPLRNSRASAAPRSVGESPGAVRDRAGSASRSAWPARSTGTGSRCR